LPKGTCSRIRGFERVPEVTWMKFTPVIPRGSICGDGIAANRNVCRHANVCEHLLGVLGIQFDLGELTHLDPIEPDFTALAQPVHGPLEDDVIVLEISVEVELGKPDAKGEKAHKER
jgi:hypothetical protein